jgi:Outer membrane receptor proteins, mostly Fe transport
MSVFKLARRGLPALLSLGLLYAQSDATVTGVVTDPGQAVMPAVNITIRNVDTNIARTMQTNQEGYFTFTSLPPGIYELIAEKEGFRSFHETGIELQVGQELRSDVKLNVGAVSESVNVTAQVAPLNSENGAIKGDVIVQQEIQDVPLNGRDFTELALLVPGVVANAPGGAGSAFAINGARGDNTGYYVDGFNDRNVRGAAAQLRPNIDALQEFKMEVGGYSAEYGKMAGGIMNMVLRSGTNQYHGSLFEYFRNDFFDAKAYFDTTDLGLHQNQWGGTILGPLNIPKVYKGRDRTFFMFSWESYRLTWGQTKLGNVPTALERAGDFSKTVNNAGKHIVIKNPYDGNAPFPGNVIPPSLFSPVGLRVLTYYPLPNRTGLGNNYQATAGNDDKWDSFIGKVDHRFSSINSMAFRYGKRFGRSNAPWAGTDLGTFGNAIRDDRSLGGLDFTHMFSPTLLSEARFGFSRNSQREHILEHGHPTASQLGMAGSTTDPMLEGFPLINVTNYLPVGYAANEPVQFFVTDYQWSEKLTWVKASHVLKWGADISRNQVNQPYFNNSRGTMTANGNWTGNGTASNGNAVADLELGLLNAASITTQTARNYMRLTDYGLFVNDDWKISHSLTLNLGLRYELDKPPVDRYDHVANFIPALNKIIIASNKDLPNYNQLLTDAGLTNLMGVAKDYDIPRSLVYANYKGYAPRVGFAWRPFNSEKMVVRGGYGIFYSGNLLNDIRNGLDNTFPFVLKQNFARLATDPAALTLANPFNPARGTQTGTTTSTGYELHPALGYLQSYNLTVERDIGFGAVAEIGYVGSKGTHLGRQYDINLPFRSVAYYQANLAFPVPYPPLGVIDYWDFNSNSIYNAGQVTLRRRASGGFFYRISYSYSKSIDTASQLTGTSTLGFAKALDPRNLSLERARSDWDRGHVFQASFAWPVPVGRGKKFLSGAGKVSDGFLGGWQLAGTSVFESGPPLTVEDSTVNAAIGESTRPNRIASGNLLAGAGRRGIDYPWYDPAAFVHVPACLSRTDCSPDQYGFLPFAPGNSGRGILDAPGLQNINLSLLKNWVVGERKRIQFRWEVFNIFNHPNFVLLNRNYNETGAGILHSVAESGNGGPRIMQFALRYEF